MASAPAVTGAVQPGAMTPQAPSRRLTPVQKTKPSKRVLPGDLICGQCGEGNAPTRKFCSRCGTSLETAVTARTRWWKKLIPHRKPKSLAAGERPWGSPTEPGAKRKRRGFSLAKVLRPILRLAGIAVLIASLVYGVSSPFRGAVNKRLTSAKNSVMSKIKPQYLQIRPISAKASSENPDHAGGLAVDGFKNTYWLTKPGDAQPTLVVTFDRPVSLAKIIVHDGQPDNYQSTNRPEQFHLVFSNGASFDVTLKDDPNPHTYSVKSSGKFTTVEIHVLQIYKSFSPSGTALAEVEFFQRK